MRNVIQSLFRPSTLTKKPALIMGAILLTGCATIRTDATFFHGANSTERGTIAVVAIDEQQKNSLEFRAVSDRVGQRLVEKGYSLARDPLNAQFVAFITYGIDNGRTVSGSVPLYGQTGGGSSFSSGTFRSSSGATTTYSGTTTRIPTYGVVGAAPISATVYKRDLNIDIYRQGAKDTDKVFEIRASSQGSCGNINAVIYDIIDGVFKNFPGQSGQAMKLDIPATGKC